MSYLEPDWVDFKHRRPAHIPAGIYDWLRDEGSLTRRVIEYCAGDFRVRLLQQHWAKPLVGEARLLNVRQSDTALIREVELLCDEQALIFARSIIPASSLTGEARKLLYLGEKPLGALLFSDPATRRNKIQVARIAPKHLMYDAAVGHLKDLPDELWGRRTLFQFSGKPLLVNEVFLPEITDAG